MNKPYIPLIQLMLALGLLLTAACKKESIADTTAEPVIQGYLIPGQPVSIIVNSQKGLADTAKYGARITGLALKISDGSKEVQLTETGTGVYTYTDTSFLATGKTYTLSFTYQGTTVSASTVMPAKTSNFKASLTQLLLPPRTYFTTPNSVYTDSVAVTYTWSNPNAQYHVLIFKNDDGNPTSTRFNYDLPVNSEINVKQASAYNADYLDFNYVGTYRVILCTVNQEYADALTSNANSSSQQLGNPPSNIKNGFGLFTAMQTDTIPLIITQRQE